MYIISNATERDRERDWENNVHWLEIGTGMFKKDGNITKLLWKHKYMWGLNFQGFHDFSLPSN